MGCVQERAPVMALPDVDQELEMMPPAAPMIPPPDDELDVQIALTDATACAAAFETLDANDVRGHENIYIQATDAESATRGARWLG